MVRSGSEGSARSGGARSWVCSNNQVFLSDLETGSTLCHLVAPEQRNTLVHTSAPRVYASPSTYLQTSFAAARDAIGGWEHDTLWAITQYCER